ncbi:MAG TPA: hypothetical protein VGF16_05755 [Bryobacteraceae bacterium]|jgi:hypothetical protein
MNSPAAAFRHILETLDQLGIPYCIVGSVASSVYGTPRTTMDVDLVADLRATQLGSFAAALHPDFYADLEMMTDALRRGRSFNVIHLASAYKFDIFPLAEDEYSQESFGRRRVAKTQGLGDEAVECVLATVEDTVLNKLRWYRLGGETSEVQWNDLHGILMVTGERLDREYLYRWAPRLSVVDLLDRLLNG